MYGPEMRVVGPNDVFTVKDGILCMEYSTSFITMKDPDAEASNAVTIKL
jgi:hypothetical protein